jgi:hypothetical protein
MLAARKFLDFGLNPAIKGLEKVNFTKYISSLSKISRECGQLYFWGTFFVDICSINNYDYVKVFCFPEGCPETKEFHLMAYK